MDMFDTFADAYVSLRCQLLDANLVSPRGNQTREICGASFAIRYPRSRLGYHEKRQYNLPFALAEATLLFQESKSVKLPSLFNHNVCQFADDEILYGAYGARIHQSIYDVVEKLRNDADSRQAVLTIYNSFDMRPVVKDVPCTIALHFMIRNNKLNLHVYMRSNDIFWGTMYDVVMFTILQEVVANHLGIDVGIYYHTSSSLHVYQRHFGMLEEIHELEPVAFDVPYDISFMRELAHFYTSLCNGKLEDKLYCSLYPFSNIFAAAYCKKMKIPNISAVPQWADLFMKINHTSQE